MYFVHTGESAETKRYHVQHAYNMQLYTTDGTQYI